MNSDRSPIPFLSALIIFAFAPSVFADALGSIAKSLSSGVKHLRNDKAASVPLPYYDGRESPGSSVVADRLSSKIVDIGKMELVDRARTEGVLRELGLQFAGLPNEQAARQLGHVLGVESIVTG